MMTINFDTITNNYEVIYVIKTVMKYHLKKSKKDSSTMLPELTEFVPATRMGIARKVL
jgi:hypothetical protein